jgi:hypothetical protein
LANGRGDAGIELAVDTRESNIDFIEQMAAIADSFEIDVMQHERIRDGQSSLAKHQLVDASGQAKVLLRTSMSIADQEFARDQANAEIDYSIAVAPRKLLDYGPPTSTIASNYYQAYQQSYIAWLGAMRDSFADYRETYTASSRMVRIQDAVAQRQRDMARATADGQLTDSH